MKYRLAQRGDRTVYIEHGVWYDQGSKHIHVTVPGSDGAHWSYSRTDKKFPLYRAMLEHVGR